jgi:hypothetical protein
MVNIKFINECAIGQSDGHPVTRAADINADAKGVRVHQRLLLKTRLKEISS